LFKAPPRAPIEEELPTASDKQPVKVKIETVEPRDDKLKSLLRVFRSTVNDDPTPANSIDEEVQEDQDSETDTGGSVEVERLGEEREKKLLAMLERALTRGVTP
jgi:hypothetical protein